LTGFVYCFTIILSNAKIINREMHRRIDTVPVILDTASTGRPTDRIRHLAGWGQVMCAAGIVLTLGITLLALMSADLRDHIMFGGLQINGGAPFPLSTTARQTILLMMLPGTLCNALALWAGYQLFGSYRDGEIFTQTAGHRMARVGWYILASAPLGLAIKALLAKLLYSQTQADGASINLSPTVADLDVSAIAFGLLAIIVGRVLREAARLSDENRSFV
jgi:hypothetical protein